MMHDARHRGAHAARSARALARSSPRPRTRAVAALAAAIAILTSAPGQAQQTAPTVYTFCFMPGSGVVYRIAAPGLQDTCNSTNHVEFSFTEGVPGHMHGTLNGLDEDDHAQYLLVDPQTRALIAELNANGNKVIGLAAATANGEAVRYEQAVKLGDAAGGDLAGSYPNPGVARIQGHPVSDEAPAVDQVLAWDGARWAPATPASVITSHGGLAGLDADDHKQYLLADGTRALTGDLSAAANRITNLAAGTANGDAINFGQLKAVADQVTALDGAVKTGDAAGGDLSGSYPDPIVAGLRGRPVADEAPSDGDVLTWNAGQGRWGPTAAPGGASNHGGLQGLDQDDHVQYLLTDGVRTATDGFAVMGTLDAGSIPVEGDGVRMMWYPGKAAFRAGRVWAGSSHLWNDANIGSYSAAFGQNTTASGTNSFAIGHGTIASGGDSFAAGFVSVASGARSVAMGFRASTNDPAGTPRHGVFVFADNFASGIVTRPTNDHQAVIRAFNGLRFFNSHGNSFFSFESDGTGTGCRILSGNLTCTGSITGASDVNLKMDFTDLDPEGVLTRLADMPVREWSYREDGPAVRHVGPTAQDFRAAFGLGQDDRTISVLDASGINVLAIQALEARTRTLDDRVAELESMRAAYRTLEAAHAALAAEHAALRERLARLEAAVLDRPAAGTEEGAAGGRD